MDTIVINDLFSAIFNVLYFAVILATIFIVILDNRNPVKTMAWILVLFFLPIVGLVFYFFFGQNTRKERLISRKGYSRLNKRPLAEYQAQESLKEQIGKSQYFSLMNPFLSCPFLDKSPFSLFLSCLLILKASLLKSWDTSVEIQ